MILIKHKIFATKIGSDLTKSSIKYNGLDDIVTSKTQFVPLIQNTLKMKLLKIPLLIRRMLVKKLPSTGTRLRATEKVSCLESEPISTMLFSTTRQFYKNERFWKACSYLIVSFKGFFTLPNNREMHSNLKDFTIFSYLMVFRWVSEV